MVKSWKHFLYNQREDKDIYTLHDCTLSVSSVQLLSCVQLFESPWITARQAFLSITNSQSLSKLMFIKSVIWYSHLIFCHPLLLLPSIFPRIRVFSNESALLIRWPKYWSFSFNISPSNKHMWVVTTYWIVRYRPYPSLQKIILVSNVLESRGP